MKRLNAKLLLGVLAAVLILGACQGKKSEPAASQPPVTPPATEETGKITIGTALSDSITAYQEKWYWFTAETGKTYNIKWNDSFDGDGTKTADIFVGGYKKDKSSVIFYYEDSGWAAPYSMTAIEDKVYLKVIGYDNSAGSFSILVY